MYKFINLKLNTKSADDVSVNGKAPLFVLVIRYARSNTGYKPGKTDRLKLVVC